MRRRTRRGRGWQEIKENDKRGFKRGIVETRGVKRNKEGWKREIKEEEEEEGGGGREEKTSRKQRY